MAEVGRPPTFESVTDMDKAINSYFNSGIKVKRVAVGKPPNQQVVDVPVPTITGLCYHIGFESRQSFYDYEERPEFSYTVKRARLWIEREYEEQLQVGNTIGAIFALKNMGWKDRNEIAPVDPDGNALKQELTIKIIRDTASSITPGDFTPKSTTGTEPGEAV